MTSSGLQIDWRLINEALRQNCERPVEMSTQVDMELPDGEGLALIIGGEYRGEYLSDLIYYGKR